MEDKETNLKTIWDSSIVAQWQQWEMTRNDEKLNVETIVLYSNKGMKNLYPHNKQVFIW
jgi:hypothetical protein